MQKIKIHVTSYLTKGEGMDKQITPICSCGWKGHTEEASNDYMWSNLREQISEHENKTK